MFMRHQLLITTNHIDVAPTRIVNVPAPSSLLSSFTFPSFSTYTCAPRASARLSSPSPKPVKVICTYFSTFFGVLSTLFPAISACTISPMLNFPAMSGWHTGAMANPGNRMLLTRED